MTVYVSQHGGAEFAASIIFRPASALDAATPAAKLAGNAVGEAAAGCGLGASCAPASSN